MVAGCCFQVLTMEYDMLEYVIIGAFVIAGVLMLLGAFLPDPDINRRDAINRLRDKERARIRRDNARRAGGGE